jgi:hypothetical protein
MTVIHTGVRVHVSTSGYPLCPPRFPVPWGRHGDDRQTSCTYPSWPSWAAGPVPTCKYLTLSTTVEIFIFFILTIIKVALCLSCSMHFTTPRLTVLLLYSVTNFVRRRFRHPHGFIDDSTWAQTRYDDLPLSFATQSRDSAQVQNCTKRNPMNSFKSNFVIAATARLPSLCGQVGIRCISR